ncbi:cytochrome P450 [Suillus fuscotomentosus]|uniref:Cytochrome P450 n=1 Tax=Suillus fuscotomentosus TaxID=1912939 RepID=A0AAD4HLG5_9AGAM|nr:cytochrome P450 [Suillus fuscotomentosus]KAG1899819.1 cytochrome P450 [Suillus fuscotomentosus]
MLQLPNLRITDNTSLTLDVVACVGVIGTIVWVYLRKSDSRLPLPPSPPTWRLQGHLLPPRDPSLTLAQWIDQYGPLITIRSGIQNTVIIGRHKAAVDIMEKQGRALADRPRLVAAGEILTRGQSLVFIHVGDRLRRMRRFVVAILVLHMHLQPKSAETYEPLQMSQARSLILNILDDPSNFQNHAISYAAATILQVAYGKTSLTSATDPEVKEARHLISRLRTVLRPGAYCVESIPWLKFLPWYAPELRDDYKRATRLYTDQLNCVKLQMHRNEDIGPSFSKHLLENGHLYDLTDMEMAYLAGGFFGAGTETVRRLFVFFDDYIPEVGQQTATAICTVLMAAAHFPEEQAKVQAELDAVIGRGRAPTFADKPSLPHLEAFISEALRWRPLVPFGLPHRTTEDVIWASENYCIPAGTTVFGNQWSISRDPEVYPDPDAFKPQRWIDSQGRLRDDLAFFVYGFGYAQVNTSRTGHDSLYPDNFLNLMKCHRSVFINSLLSLWAFQLSLDPTKPQDDMGFSNTFMPNVPCAIEFQARVPEVELRHMMQNYPEAG